MEVYPLCYLQSYINQIPVLQKNMQSSFHSKSESLLIQEKMQKIISQKTATSSIWVGLWPAVLKAIRRQAEIFYLQGGFDFNKLHGIYKFMMKMMNKIVGSSVEKKAEKTEDEIIMLKLIKDGGDFVTKDNLNPVIEWMSKAN